MTDPNSEFQNKADVEYSPSVWHEGGLKLDKGSATLEQFTNFIRSESQIVRDQVTCELGIAYGTESSQKYDLFGANLDSQSPIVCFFHGGYWVFGCREHSAWMVKPLIKAGIRVAIVGYTLAPKASLDEIVQDVQQAVKKIQQNHEGKIWLTGHSAGAHLITAAMILDDNLKVEGLLPISGLYDLEPLVETYVASEANFDRETLLRNSVMKPELAERLKDRCFKVILAVGEFEPPRFVEQMQRFAKLLSNSGVNVLEMIISGENHFSIAQQLADPEFKLTKELIGHVQKSIVPVEF